jgi:hypothetical protein
MLPEMETGIAHCDAMITGPLIVAEKDTGTAKEAAISPGLPFIIVPVKDTGRLIGASIATSSASHEPQAGSVERQLRTIKLSIYA